jgi:hypothetical protein
MTATFGMSASKESTYSGCEFIKIWIASCNLYQDRTPEGCSIRSTCPWSGLCIRQCGYLHLQISLLMMGEFQLLSQIFDRLLESPEFLGAWNTTWLNHVARIPQKLSRATATLVRARTRATSCATKIRLFNYRGNICNSTWLFRASDRNQFSMMWAHINELREDPSS